MQLSFREITHQSEDYLRTVALRDVVLRQPLGLRFSEEELLAENDSWHLAVFSEQDLLACLILKPMSKTEIKMRQVAVRPDAQGKGIGSFLVRAAEQFAFQHGFHHISLHARFSALPFYLQLDGYQLVGDAFSEVGIPHRKMIKSLV